MNTPQKLFTSIQLGTGATVLYTQPSSTGNKLIIKNLTLVNTNASSRTVSLYLVNVGQAPSAANTLLDAWPLSAKNTVGSRLEYVGRDLMLGPGDSIQALASAATSVTAFGSGLEIS